MFQYKFQPEEEMKFSVNPAADGAKADDDVNKGPTDEFYRIKALADKQYDTVVQ